MNKYELAGKLNGREYGSEITTSEEQAAAANGLVVVFGYSDDNIELRGVIHDEAGCYDGGIFTLDKQGLISEWPDHEDRNKEDAEEYFKRVLGKKWPVIEAEWNKDGYSWTYKTEIPHATFDIMEDGEKFCRGIVFSITDISAKIVAY